MTIDVDNKKSFDPEHDWQNIETVMLDMDGTLLDLHFDNQFWLTYVPQCYARKHRLTDKAAHEKLMQKYNAVRGQLDWYCVDYWSKQLELDIEQLKHDMVDKIALRPEVDGFLSWLNKQRKRIVLVTNAHPISLWLKMDKTGLHSHFDKIIHAHELGLAKEHAGFWKKLQSLESYRPTKTMLIDDNIAVLDSAHRYGIQYCMGIYLPDSQGEAIDNAAYPLVKNFKDIIYG